MSDHVQLVADLRQWSGSVGQLPHLVQTLLAAADALDGGTDRTDAQNRAYHACLTRWIRAALPEYLDGGLDRGLARLKAELLRGCFGVHIYQSRLTGEVVTALVEPHTSSLSKKRFSELMDYTIQVAAEHGYVMEAPEEFRERAA